MDLLIGAWKFSVERVALTNSEITQLYDSSAAWWDFMQRLAGMTKAYERLFRRLRREGLLRSAGNATSVLDLGIGTGLFSEALIRATEARFELSGIDLSPKMLDKSRAKLSQFGLQANLLCRKASSLPFEDGALDLVISAFMIENASDPLQVLREAARVARSKAPLVLVVVPPHAPDYPIRLRYRYRPFDPIRLRGLLTQSGWENVRQFPLPGRAWFFGTAYVAEKS